MTFKSQSFKLTLAGAFAKVLGHPVSKNTAWQLFKTSVGVVVDQLCEMSVKAPNEVVTLPLSGVGTFSVQQRQPRQIPKKYSTLVEELLKRGSKLPKLKFQPSIGIRGYIIQKTLGLNPDGTKFTDEQIPLDFDGEADDDVNEMQNGVVKGILNALKG